MYAITSPWWLRRMAPPGLIWEMPPGPEPAVYLTFDDGPHPIATPLVLQQLAAQEAKASFFCIGKNVAAEPELFAAIQAAGHCIGNHTFRHLNAWDVKPEAYLEDIRQAAALIPGHLFRPPYGRISRRVTHALKEETCNWKLYMWTILSGDFDTKISPQKCLSNVLRHIRPGAIIVFHDSAKALDRLRYVLPFVIDHCRQQGWALRALPSE